MLLELTAHEQLVLDTFEARLRLAQSLGLVGASLRRCSRLLRAGPRVRVPRGGGCHGSAARSAAHAPDVVRSLTCATQGGPLRVRVYALADSGLQVPGSVWDYNAWRAAHLDAFVRMCADFSAREFPAGEVKGQ